MLTQAGLGLLAGDKPASVLRNVACFWINWSRYRCVGENNTFMSGVQKGFGI